MNRLHTKAFILALLIGSNAGAQTIEGVNESMIRRLGLVFQRVEQADISAGMEVPATVISSPFNAASVTALFDGVLQTWQAMPGEQVAAGTLLGTVRSPEVLDIQQQWLSARAEEAQAQAMLDRDRSLFDQGIIAQSRLQVTELAARNARVLQQSLTARLQTAGYDTADLQKLEQEGSQLGIYRLRAPADGMISHLHYMSGESFTSGEEVVSLTSNTLWVSAELPSALAAEVSTGQQLGLSGQPANLVVRMKEQALDLEAQTQGVLAEFTGDVSLQTGQIVRLVIPASSQGVLVPDDAVVHNGDQTAVFVRTSDGIEQRTLELQALGGNYLATSGIQPGESVVVRGAAILKGIILGLGGE
jgi:cobalt-zinc-cadmium efflux system membrane fusion protein